MLDVTDEEFQDALREVERRLLGLADGLDAHAARNTVEFSMLALGHRARSVFCAFVAVAESDGAGAAMILIRPAVEINLTLRFIAVQPDIHAELWVAESERQSLVFVRKFVEDRELVAKHENPFDLKADWFTEREAFINDVRSRALERGVAGVGHSGPLMPPMEVIAQKYGDLAAREAYALAYRPLSDQLHVGARSFRPEQFIEQEDGYLLREVPPSSAERALNASTFASTLCILSEPLNLAVVDEAAMLKEGLLRARITEP